MSSVFTPSSIEKTTLFKRLQHPFASEADNQVAEQLASELPSICKSAYERMQLMQQYHEEFTLHDHIHLLRVTELMALVLPSEVLNQKLNPVEIALLILAAHFHDVGMVPDEQELEEIHASEDFDFFRKQWLVDYAGFKEAISIIDEEELSDDDGHRVTQVAEEFEQIAMARYLRDTHAKRSASYVRKRFSDNISLQIGTSHLSETLAILCESHNWSPSEITEGNNFFVDKSIGPYSVNMPYLAVILRLADILDFDRERTPDDLFKSINFRSPVSIKEWEKHRQVTGWRIQKKLVRFECSCERPEYEKSIRQFLDWIDHELWSAQEIVKRFPIGHEGYTLDLPVKCDRSRVGPKGNAYIYAEDLEVGLSREEIVRLLMTKKLYKNSSLVIREILQNAWDALRHRKAIMKAQDKVDWHNGAVELEHGLDEEGREFVTC